MTLEKIQEYCKSIELSKKHKHIKMLSPSHELETVDVVKFSQKCKRCDTEHPIRQCSAFQKTRAVCQRRGHYAKMFFQKSKQWLIVIHLEISMVTQMEVMLHLIVHTKMCKK